MAHSSTTSSIRALYLALAEDYAQRNELDKSIEEKKKALADLIKPNEVEDGVKHTFIERPSTRWADAYKETVAKLVPKTKLPDAARIASKYTTTTAYSRFTDAAEGT